MARGEGPGPRRRAGDERPSKPCAHCGRPMQWRRKWARVWDEVLYCSKRCAGEARDARARARRSDAVDDAAD